MSTTTITRILTSQTHMLKQMHDYLEAQDKIFGELRKSNTLLVERYTNWINEVKSMKEQFQTEEENIENS